MHQEQGQLLNSLVKEVIKAIRWIHEHAEIRAARFLTEVQGVFNGNAAFEQAYAELQSDPDLPKATADMASAMSYANEEDYAKLAIILKGFVEAQADFKPLDPLKAYQRGEAIGMDALKSSVSLEVQMERDDTNEEGE